MPQTLKQIYDAWNALTLRQRLSMIVSVAATFAAVSAIVWWARQPDWAVFKTGLEPRDAQAVVTELQNRGIPLRLRDGGTTIEVPQEQVHRLRMELTAKGIGTTGRFGFAQMFDSESVSQSTQMQEIRYKKALEDELARTIEALDDVSWARVHLVLPGERIFIDDDEQAKASVMLGLAGGGALSAQEVQAVVRTVVGAVKDLGPENVYVAESRGRVLWSGEGEASAALGSKQIELKTALEQDINAKIARVLDSVVGATRYRVQSTVDLDMERVLRRETTYDPDSGVLVSEQKTKEQSTGPAAPGGVPGVTANVGGGGATGAGESQTRSESTSSFRYSQVEKTVEEPVGRIRRVSVAVVVDQNWNEDPATGERTPVPRSAEELADIEQFVKAAIGFDEDRGDRVTVTQRPLVAPVAEPPERGFDPRVWLPVIKYPALILLFLMAFLLFIRPLLRTLGALARPLAERPATGLASLDAASLGPPSEVELLRQRLTALAGEHPEGMAQTMRVWLHEKEG
ncbi:MAG: flagellar basal-body MS-ring/collar protein FliF [Acidobacteriota bacterium]